MSSGKGKSKPASQPKPSRKHGKKLFLAILIIAVASLIILAPALYYGSFTLPVAKLEFNETTSVGQPPTYSGNLARVEADSVYLYVYSIETAGIFRTNSPEVSAAQGTARIIINGTITTSYAKVVNLASTLENGGIGQRSHTVYLGPNEGVGKPGLYSASVTISATVNPVNGPVQTGSVIISSFFFVIPSY